MKRWPGGNLEAGNEAETTEELPALFSRICSACYFFYNPGPPA